MILERNSHVTFVESFFEAFAEKETVKLKSKMALIDFKFFIICAVSFMYFLNKHSFFKNFQ
jgi:hypothetical protein